jgi:hypothetical protein
MSTDSQAIYRVKETLSSLIIFWTIIMENYLKGKRYNLVINCNKMSDMKLVLKRVLSGIKMLI